MNKNRVHIWFTEGTVEELYEYIRRRGAVYLFEHFNMTEPSIAHIRVIVDMTAVVKPKQFYMMIYNKMKAVVRNGDGNAELSDLFLRYIQSHSNVDIDDYMRYVKHANGEHLRRHAGEIVANIGLGDRKMICELMVKRKIYAKNVFSIPELYEAECRNWNPSYVLISEWISNEGSQLQPLLEMICQQREILPELSWFIKLAAQRFPDSFDIIKDTVVEHIRNRCREYNEYLHIEKTNSNTWQREHCRKWNIDTMLRILEIHPEHVGLGRYFPGFNNAN